MSGRNPGCEPVAETDQCECGDETGGRYCDGEEVIHGWLAESDVKYAMRIASTSRVVALLRINGASFGIKAA